MIKRRLLLAITLAGICALSVGSCCPLLRSGKTCTGKGAPESLPAPAREQLAGHIVFISDRDDPSGEIYTMRADGSQITRLTHNQLAEAHPSVSPDGKQVVFAVSAGGIYTLDLAACAGQPGGCGLASLRRILDHGQHPEWSPDGRYILFNEGDVYLMNADGSGIVDLGLAPATPGLAKEGTWGPDGRSVAAVAMQMVSNLYLTRFDAAWQGTGAVWLARDGYEPAVAPDGATVALKSSDRCLCLVPADGARAPRRLTAFAAESPSWSPDGKWLAFAHDGDIGVIDAEGKHLLYLTEGPARDTMPVWYR